ncbi:hypothetical protein DL240_02515 [Lujinxingia litoralis]|uniref:TNFR-Cys domain-containing protein n=1 Tax=Lujinxingia litoralis TaxID=2211119 RepID=A0A328CBR1_9DELT|nr:hypothetical protein [Lujinxingia litoralis]RAL25106.1 hypothetical protein DL240_02515 [Lujinxingia litoralis]
MNLLPPTRPPFLSLALMLTLLGLSAACSFEPASFAGVRCDDEDEVRPGLECRDGFWVDLDAGTDADVTPLPDADVDPEPDADTDVDPGPDTDTGCQAESDLELCEAASLACGPLQVEDRCGESRDLNCGSCQASEICEEGSCVCVPESDQAFCSRQAADCGEVIAEDNCGESRTVTCGSCESGYVCGDDQRCTCPGETVSELCADNAMACGVDTVIDGCGLEREINCGGCTGPGEECTAEFSCLCEPESDQALCDAAGATCGPLTVTDRCGQTRALDCGGCTGPNESCTDDNQCACEPRSITEFCADQGAMCGVVTANDICGNSRTESCGECNGSREYCSFDHQCVCVPIDDTTYCFTESAECGILSRTDNCGEPRNIDCGSCPGQGKVCTVNNTCLACQPPTDAEICESEGAQCGTLNVIDTCNQLREVECGSCSGTGEECTSENQCLCEPQSEAELCAANNYRCGSYDTVVDNCGESREINCGGCSTGSCQQVDDVRCCSGVGLLCWN